MNSHSLAKPLLRLYCPVQEQTTPHGVGPVTLLPENRIRMACYCLVCNAQQVSIVDCLPDGYRLYRIRIVGDTNPDLPSYTAPLTRLEEDFLVPGLSRQDAKERGEFACSLRFTGHRVQYFIDGELHLDERF